MIPFTFLQSPRSYSEKGLRFSSPWLDFTNKDSNAYFAPGVTPKASLTPRYSTQFLLNYQL
jgi:hypothetical protein